ncbi:MAG TPA: alpha-L-arabinofuranosidase C-terminal domain-containing protein [Rhizomicrobium sp.]|nr:alpha-L-arabinofuranosidase C-terminal domain-containing protein [Rhizomicrobium sp.]
MTISRRSVLAASTAAPFLSTRARAADPRILIHSERHRGPIDKKIFGNFIEHLGRCITGGIFDEGSPLSDKEGFRKDVMTAVKDLGVPFLRWPGGNFSSNYNWRDGIGPRDQRPRRLEMAWGTVEDNRFGTHEFMDYVEQIGAEPYICFNLGTGSWTEAQQWVEYVNGSQDTEITRLRKKNGREKPWKVKYWGLGNEMDGYWQMGHRSAADYAAFALEAAKLAKLTDPDVKLVAAGASNYRPGSDWIGWNRTVLESLRDYADYISIHLYVGNPANDYADFVASPIEMDQKIEILAGLIEAAMSARIDHVTGQPARDGRKLYIAFDEWNVWYRARGDSQRGRRILEEHYNLEDALVVAGFLNSLVNHADVVKIANLAQLVNVIAPIFTNDKGLFLQTIYYPLQLFTRNVRGNSLDLLVDSPSYSSKRFDTVPYIDASASLDGADLVVNVVNRHRDQAMTVAIELEDKQFSGSATASEVNGPDIKAENDFGKTLVSAKTSTIEASGGRLSHPFPPHSYTQIRARLA